MPIHTIQPDYFKRSGGWQHMRIISDLTASLVGIGPTGTILIDEEVNLGPWGLVATTYRGFSTGLQVEKLVSGAWVPTIGKGEGGQGGNYTGAGAPDEPADDPASYSVEACYCASPMKRPWLSGGLDAPTGNWYNTVNGRGQNVGQDVYTYDGAPEWIGLGSPSDEDLFTRLRVVVRRTGDEYTPEQTASFDALNYRVRAVLQAHDLVLWEREVPIVESSSSYLLDEVIDLASWGYIESNARIVWVAEFRRNGKTIRTHLARESVPGEQFDPPTYPIIVGIESVYASSSQFNDQNGGGIWPDASKYGWNGTLDWTNQFDPYYFLGKAQGTWRMADINYCSEACNEHISVKVWRTGSLPSTYYDGSGTVAVPSGSGNNTTVLIRALLAPPNRVSEYPWSHGDVSEQQVTLRSIPHSAVSGGGFTPQYNDLWFNASGGINQVGLGTDFELAKQSSTSRLLAGTTLGFEQSAHLSGGLLAEKNVAFERLGEGDQVVSGLVAMRWGARGRTNDEDPVNAQLGLEFRYANVVNDESSYGRFYCVKLSSSGEPYAGGQSSIVVAPYREDGNQQDFVFSGASRSLTWPQSDVSPTGAFVVISETSGVMHLTASNVVVHTDVEITGVGQGLILRDANGARWRITVSTSGGLSSTLLV